MSETNLGGPDAVARVIRSAGPRPLPDPGFEARCRDDVREAWRSGVDGRAATRVHRWAMAAAVTAVAVMVGLALPLGPMDPVVVGSVARVEGTITLSLDGSSDLLEPGAALVAGSMLATGPAGRSSMLLSDGTQLRLDQHTTVRLADAGEIHLMDGRVYVDSGLGAGSGNLTLHTPIGTLRDIGTQFSAELRADGVLVMVREGRVALSTAAGTIPVASGEEVLLRDSGAVDRRSIAAAATAWTWTESLAPAFEVDGRSVDTFLGWVARQTGLEVHYTDPATEARASEITLGGTFPDLPPRRLLEVVMLSADLEYGIADGVITVDGVADRSP
jgi:FecR-like protein